MFRQGGRQALRFGMMKAVLVTLVGTGLLSLHIGLSLLVVVLNGLAILAGYWAGKMVFRNGGRSIIFLMRKKGDYQMFRQVMTLIRGAAHEASEDFTDRNALPLLRQQIREAATALQAARKAVAVAMVQDEREQKQHKRVLGQISDLEGRAVAALEQGRDDLAQEAAESIAFLERERESGQAALDSFSSEIRRLKNIVRRSEMRLKELDRGQRVAVATDQTQKLRHSLPDSGLSALGEAEDTLERLRRRQQQSDRTGEIMDELANEGSPEKVSERLAQAGCGKPLHSGADDVLARLKKKMVQKVSDPEGADK